MRKPLKYVLCASLCALTLFAGCNQPETSSNTQTETTAAPTTVKPTVTQPVTEAPTTTPSTSDNAREPVRKYNFLAIKQKSDAIDASLKDIIGKNNYMGSVYLKLGNDLEFIECAGYSNEVERMNNSIHTCFYTGSLTKHITATAVLQLAEQKKIDLDDKIGKYLPDCSYGDKVTVRNLLTMTSAVPGYTKETAEGSNNCVLKEELAKKVKKDSSERDNHKVIIDWILSQKLNGKPGAKFEYSDSNYYLLGDIIEKVSGTGYSAYVKENILKPLGMSRSGFKPPQNLAVSYTDGKDDCKLLYAGVGYSSLGFISNISDTIRYIEGLLDESLINSDSLMLMHTEFKDGYGYSVNISGDRMSIASTIGAYSTKITYATDESELFAAYSNYASSDSDSLHTQFKKYLSVYYI